MANDWQVSGKRSLVVVYDAAGASRNISGDLNSVTLTWTREDIPDPFLGMLAEPHVPGIREADLEGSAIYSVQESSGIDAVLTGLMAASGPALIHYYPGGSFSTLPYYSGCYLINLWEITAQAGGVVAANWSFDLSSGSLTHQVIPAPPAPAGVFTVGYSIVGTDYIGP